MEQLQQCFSYSTPRADSDGLQKSAKSLSSALQLISINQISTQKYRPSHSDSFQIARNPIEGRIRNHSDQSGKVQRMLKFYCCLIQKN